MIEKKIGNRAKTIKMATLSGLCPIQCRKSGTIMLSNGSVAIFIPEGRDFCKDEEIATVVSLCKVNHIDENLTTNLTTMISENRRDEAFEKLNESLMKAFEEENSAKRSLRANFVESLASTKGFLTLIENVGLSQDELDFIKNGLETDLATVKETVSVDENERA